VSPAARRAKSASIVPQMITFARSSQPAETKTGFATRPKVITIVTVALITFAL